MNANDVFKDLTGEKSVYTQEDKKPKEYVPIVEGEYLGHIIDVETQILDVKRDGNFKARLYKYTVQVAEENKSNKYFYKDIDGSEKETDGSSYKNYKFKGNVWRFLEPQEGDDFDSNSSGNKGYLNFCQTMGIECPTTKEKVNGKKVEVKQLPSLNTDDVVGKPVIAVIKEGRPWKDKKGNPRVYFDCKFVKKWEGGKAKKQNGAGDDIPF